MSNQRTAPELPDDLAGLVTLLTTAWHTGEAVSPPIGQVVPQDAAQAARVQHAVGARLGWWSAGAVPPFWKSGAGARNLPLKHAALPTPAVRQAPGAGPVDVSDRPWQQPLLEAEIALRLRAPVTPAQAARLAAPLSWVQCLELVDAAAVAIEVVDSRWVERGAAPELLQLADGQWHGALVRGEWFSVESLQSVNWAEQPCELWRGGERLQAVQGTHPLGDPFWLLPQWLAHLTRDGATVPAGTVVTTGNWIKAPAFEPGAAWEVRFAGLGQVAIQR